MITDKNKTKHNLLENLLEDLKAWIIKVFKTSKHCKMSDSSECVVVIVKFSHFIIISSRKIA